MIHSGPLADHLGGQNLKIHFWKWVLDLGVYHYLSGLMAAHIENKWMQNSISAHQITSCGIETRKNGWPGDVRAGPKCHEEVSSPSVPRRDMGGGDKTVPITWLAAYRQLRLPRLTMDLESANSFNYTGGSADLMTALTIPEARHLIVGQD